MQTSLHFKSRHLQEPAEIISLDAAKTILTTLSIITAIFALIELILS